MALSKACIRVELEFMDKSRAGHMEHAQPATEFVAI
jgi:hypothetical protein